jgi:Tol biopolymer transport system component
MKNQLALIAVASLCVFNSTDISAATNEQRPVCSADGTKMIFMMQTERTENDWELYLLDFESQTRSRLTSHRGWDGYAVWSPDGSSIIFDREVSPDKPKRPWIMELDGRTSKPLGRYAGRVSVTDWSDDNRLLGFQQLNGQSELVMLNRSGKIIANITETTDHNEHDAHFSPDGQKIVFANRALQGGETSLEVIDLNDGNRTVLRTSSGRIYGVSWSPEGDKIAFVDTPARTDDEADIFIYTIADQSFKQVTEEPSIDHMPMFCQNSHTLYFTSFRSGAERIYRIDPDPKPFLKIERAGK